ncbi:MAG TPA: tetratricopeptide repeat protein [Pyrinomonadaceae bacterium]|nr:tetratricopeptide repeat protein [Pyrinomonadaceae bacterium]
MMNKARFFFRSAGFASKILILLVVSFACGAAQNNVPQLTAAEWQADLVFLAETMPKQHPNLFRRMKREDFDAAVKQFHDQIPSLSEDEINVGFMKIVAMVKDGHTSVFPRNFFSRGIYPLRFYLYKDGLFVQKAAPEYAEAVGGRVVRIGNYSAEDALKMAGQAVFADNEMGIRENAPVLLSVPEILAGLKINDDKQNLKVVVQTGNAEKTFQVKPALNLRELLQPPANWIDSANSSKNQTPLYLKDARNIYWFEYLKEQKTLYVQENAVQNKQDEPLGAFYKRVFDFIAANPVEKFVLDLRNNDGGNNGLNRQVVIGLIKSKLDERGKLFVITGRRTFSAAQNLVSDLENYTNAIFVGEPTAGHPNHYGDARPVVLPNSKLEVHVSSVYWQDVDPRDTRSWTAPEIAVELTSEDYRSGRDPALQAIFEYVPGSSFQDIINAAQKNFAEFSGKYKAFKNDPKHRFIDTEAAMNRFGYALLQAKRVADALEVFKLNVEAYPNSANVYDSLGDALQAAGKKDEAIKAYEKALSIDPNYASSLDSLRKLKEQ